MSIEKFQKKLKKFQKNYFELVLYIFLAYGVKMTIPVIQS